MFCRVFREQPVGGTSQTGSDYYSSRWQCSLKDINWQRRLPRCSVSTCFGRLDWELSFTSGKKGGISFTISDLENCAESSLAASRNLQELNVKQEGLVNHALVPEHEIQRPTSLQRPRQPITAPSALQQKH
jgi:hypothetical protein